MGLINTNTGQIFADHYPHTVYHRERWFEEWAEVKYLYASSVHDGNGVDPSQATLFWKFGVGEQCDLNEFDEYQKKDLANHYIKIEIEQGTDGEGNDNDPIKWFGFIVDQQEDRLGAGMAADEDVLSGANGYLAHGIEMLLDKTILHHSRVLKSSDGSEYDLPRTLTFNAPNNHENHGNRSPEKGAEGVYIFTDDLTWGESDFWTTKTILEYLLQYEKPKAITGDEFIEWELGDDAINVLPDWDRPVLQAEGRTLFSILNQLCDRRRMLGWRCWVDDSGDSEVIKIDVFSFNKDIIVLPSGETQNENLQQIELDFDKAVDITSATLRSSSVDVVEQVRVVGARKRSIFTISTEDETLVPDWDEDDEADYSAGPTLSSEDVDLKERRRNEYRAADKFERMFSWFRLPVDWDGEVADGRGGTTYPVFPENEDEEAEEFYRPELRFERYLSREFLDSPPDDSPHTGTRPIVMLKTDYPDGTRYQNVEKIGSAAENERAGNEGGCAWSCHARGQSNAPGLILRVSGKPQYMIAKNHHTPLDTDEEPVLDYSDNLLATVMMELDSRVEVLYPPTDEIMGQPLDVARIVTIDLGENNEQARLDYVAPGCVDRHDDGIPHTSDHADDYGNDERSYLRDDRAKMRDLARFCHAWYSVPRQAFSLSFRQVSSLLDVGQLITTIGSGDNQEDVNSVVTAITWDLVRGGTQVTTSYAEIDPTRF